MHSLPYWRLSGYYFFYFAYVGAFSPYFGLLLQSRGFSAWDIGVLVSQTQLMRLFAPNLWGWVADRTHARLAVIRLTSFLAVLSFALLFWVQGFMSHLLVIGLMAFFWSASLPLAEAMTFDHLREQPARYSRIRLWGSVGFIVTVLGIGALLDHAPLSTLLPSILALLGGVLLCALAVPDVAPSEHAANPSVSSILRQPRVRAMLAASFCMASAHGAYYVFYSIFLTQHGYSKAMVGGLWSLGVIAEIGVFLLMPRWLPRLGLRQVLLACYAAAALRFVLIGMGVEVLGWLLLAQVLHGLTFGAHHAASIAAIHRWFPGRAQARGQALYSSLSFGAGGLFGGVLSGWSWEHLGGGLTFALSGGFALVGVVLIARWLGREAEAATE
jgi:PPP family 3-phenylpropionic acid transporter